MKDKINKIIQELIDEGILNGTPKYIKEVSSFGKAIEKSYNQALLDVHSEFAEFYDECFKKNKINAQRNVSIIISKLKGKVDGLKVKL